MTSLNLSSALPHPDPKRPAAMAWASVFANGLRNHTGELLRPKTTQDAVRHLLLLFLSQLEFATPVIQRERPLPQLPSAQSGQVTPLDAGATRERSRMNEPLLTRIATMRVRATSGGSTRQISARPLRLDCLDCLICFQYSRRGAVLALLFPAASRGSPAGQRGWGTEAEHPEELSFTQCSTAAGL